MQLPETRFAWNGEVALAYQAFGSGDHDLLYLPGVISNVDVMWVAGTRRGPEPNRVLTTILFSDIVGSSGRASELGDAAWHQLLERHHRVVRDELSKFGGVEQDTAGDGFFAAFDGPAGAVRCAQAISHAVRSLGLEVRIGLHTGECEIVDGKVSGIAAITGARVMAQGGPSEILVSRTVKDLVAGSGLAFEDAGEHELKGVPDRWRLYRVDDRSSRPSL